MTTSIETSLSWEVRKQSGVHFTPVELAKFVAAQTIGAWNRSTRSGVISILDPAVGDAALLDAILEAVIPSSLKVRIVGFDTSEEAVRQAEMRMAMSNRTDIVYDFRQEDFLEHVIQFYLDDASETLFPAIQREQFDLVISNPPYVRTQVLGAEKSQLIARRFSLAGRVDIYYAFLEAIARVLRPGGIAGVIVSNRFMTVRSGATIRERLRKQFNLLHVWDLGDTKIFEAAVLPAVILLQKKGTDTIQGLTHFTSIYSSRSDSSSDRAESPVAALSKQGHVQLPDGTRFFVKQGVLDHAEKLDAVWKVVDQHSRTHMATVQIHTNDFFQNLGKVRVGVKSTADKVFIRDDWDSLPDELRPELLRPILTHHSARNYRALNTSITRKILYPHEMVDGRRVPCDLSRFPRTAAYLQQHRSILEARTYLKKSARRWYELWVPQSPELWSKPKLVFRDISEKPTFWVDLSGAVVNGDCYWLPVEDVNDPKLWLALAVANSSFIEWYYDTQFNNKLYAGRRRFMTQYVEKFPLPEPNGPYSKNIIRLARQLYDLLGTEEPNTIKDDIDTLVWDAFGLSPEEVRR